jgi:hypothetical protein
MRFGKLGHFRTLAGVPDTLDDGCLPGVRCGVSTRCGRRYVTTARI